MGNLNSVLIEGTAVTDATADAAGQQFAVFTISSISAGEANYIDIEADGKLAGFCLSKIRKGREIRAVGKIRKPKSRPAVIAAEHIELKPECAKETTSLDAYKDTVSAEGEKKDETNISQ
ncbi:MAG: hypothetical protein LBP69_09635 [Treponema sp.]|jgi:single-strand DNA-binding protein|nr:hypothetical protein [Treponema sp.]